MTPKQRVHAALGRRQTDRIPVFMWFHPGTTARLGSLLELPADHVGEALGNDVRQTWVGNNQAMEGIVHGTDGETHTDVWGITWVKEGPFNQVLRSPLAEADDHGLMSYGFPATSIETLLHPMDALLPYAEEWFIGCDVSPCQFELLCRIRGMERALEDLALRPDTAAFLLERAADFCAELSDAACNRYPLDWLWTGDDVAGQQSLMMSPKQWRLLIKPQLARIVSVGKRHNLPVAFHCCGAVRPIVPDLIEIGIDVLNPIQCNCPGMDAAELKRDFGAHLSFMGGVDTVHLLPHGNADDVYRETRGLVEVMTTDGGGYILAASHTIPPETPLENIFAMYRAAGITREEIFDRAAVLRAGTLSADRTI